MSAATRTAPSVAEERSTGTRMRRGRNMGGFSPGGRPPALLLRARPEAGPRGLVGGGAGARLGARADERGPRDGPPLLPGGGVLAEVEAGDLAQGAERRRP